ARSHAWKILTVHLIRNSYLLPVPSYRALHPPFIHSIIENPDFGISWSEPKIVQVFRPFVRSWNALSPITGFAGLWMSVMFFLFIFRKRHFGEISPTFAMALAVELILLIFAPIPDGRYALFVLIAGQASGLGYAFDFIQKRRELKSA
ncbi:MAG: hypothetical protein NTX12_01215, partial [Actinobacteria bacterium]|nr:hypothetical protein [Actinomycetota bacterium]